MFLHHKIPLSGNSKGRVLGNALSQHQLRVGSHWLCQCRVGIHRANRHWQSQWHPTPLTIVFHGEFHVANVARLWASFQECPISDETGYKWVNGVEWHPNPGVDAALVRFAGLFASQHNDLRFFDIDVKQSAIVCSDRDTGVLTTGLDVGNTHDTQVLTGCSEVLD
jgi:hypothetical protein